MTIFISIAAYEDPALIRTMQSAIDNADCPDDIYFGVGLQYENPPDISQFNAQTIYWHPDERPGIVRIRYEISKLYHNQAFYLQIDSHYGFTPGWDTKLCNTMIELKEETGSYKNILLPLEMYGDEVMTSRWKMEKMDYDPAWVFRAVPDNGRKIPTTKLEEIPFMRVGQIFFDGRFIQEVGFDPWSQLEQEQAYLGFRAFMMGWRFFQLHERIIYQDDYEYLMSNVKVNNDGKLGGPLARDNHFTPYEMALAYLFNDYSKYAMPNAVKTPAEYWEMQGQLSEFTEIRKESLSYLHNNLQ